MSAAPPGYRSVLDRLETAAARGGTSLEVLGEVRHGETTHPLKSLVLGRGAPRRALLSAGIHGDEPAGVLALTEFIESGRYRLFLGDWELTLIPCINPHGYEAATRLNPAGQDLNREFKSASPAREVALVQSVFTRRFNLSMELHEDNDSPGYYLYQKSRFDRGKFPGEQILKAVQGLVPLNAEEEIDGMPSDGGVIHRLSGPEAMDWWPMALYSMWKETEICLTLESPTLLSLQTRVLAHVTAIEAALRLCR